MKEPLRSAVALWKYPQLAPCTAAHRAQRRTCAQFPAKVQTWQGHVRGARAVPACSLSVLKLWSSPGPSPEPGGGSAKASSWPGSQASSQKPCGDFLQLPSLRGCHWTPAVSRHILQSGCLMRLGNSLRTFLRPHRLLTRACRAPAGRPLALADAQGAWGAQAWQPVQGPTFYLSAAGSAALVLQMQSISQAFVPFPL